MGFRIFLLTGILPLLLLGSCGKNDAVPEAGTPVHNPLYLLDKVEYRNAGTTSFYTYDTDSTVLQIVRTGAQPVTALEYSYNGKQIKKSVVAGYADSTVYTYTNGYLTGELHTAPNGSGKRGYRLDYFYGTNGLLEEMREYTTDSTGEHLLFSHVYQYNIEGWPARITSTGMNVVYTTSIHTYSEECDFESSAFTGLSGLGELSAIYNYPVLSRLRRLPGDITVTRSVEGGSPVTEKIYDITFSISNKKLNNMRTAVHYPAKAGDDTRDEWVFYYK